MEPGISKAIYGTLSEAVHNRQFEQARGMMLVARAIFEASAGDLSDCEHAARAELDQMLAEVEHFMQIEEAA